MRKYLYKYPVETLQNKYNCINGKVDLPNGAVVISCAIDPEKKMCFYAIVDPDETEMVTKYVMIAPTGMSFERVEWDFLQEECEFFGTFKDGIYMWHVWVQM